MDKNSNKTIGANGKPWKAGRVLKGLALWATLVTASLSVAQSSGLAPDLQGIVGGATGTVTGLLQGLTAPLAPVRVIVQYRQPPNNTNFLLAQVAGGVLQQNLGLINAAVYSIPAGNILSLLNADPLIAYVSPDRIVGATLDNAAAAIGANTAFNSGYNGTGVTVAVIDSGITVVKDLRTANGDDSRVLMSQSFVSGSSSTNDLYGHGDHVAGIVAGNGARSNCSNCFKTIRGIAPNARVVNLRVLDQNGSGTDSAVIAAIQRAVELKKSYNVQVINLSLGRPVAESYTQDPLCQAVEAAWKAGIVVVVAAGNYGRDNSNNTHGYGTITSPGNDPYVITVGAMKTMGTPDRSDDLIATYSSKGPTMLDHVVKPDLVAPGNLVVSLLASTNATLYTSYPQNAVPLSYYASGYSGNSQYYYRLSGTSMAAPMVSGAAALLLQQNPYLSPDQVKARLMKTAYKNFPASSSYTDPSTSTTYTDYYDIFTVGAGYVDVVAALNSNDTAPATAGSAQSPSAAVDSSSGDVYLVDGSSVVWGSSSTWANSVVWGSSVVVPDSGVNGNSVVWGSSASWANSTDQGYSVVWGSSVVSGSQTQSDTMSVAINGDN